MTNSIADKIALRFSIGSGRRLRQLASTAAKTGDLTHQPGQGAKFTVLEEVNKSMEAQAKEFGYAFTLEAMAEAVKADIGKGSKRTIMRAMTTFMWRRRRQKIKPFLTLKHMSDRLKWAKKWATFKYAENNKIAVMVDEKWFYAFKEGICRDKLIPAILAKINWKGAEVLVILDSAGGHSIDKILPRLHELGQKQRVKISFDVQSTRSPDFNALDLGIWNSMQSKVALVKYQHSSDKTMTQRILDAVEAMWATYDSQKITNIFQLLPRIHECVIETNGGNTYKLPRKNKK